ncbi:hypothetical protein M2152_002043 [Microbacteriaceae bacterium SG_E_30_P1]|uniref:DUF218 domain-containing protein n=1 Tax=Antiquaquibacter oligotrophicus TaxID=2880260 RepID=A0ABT6KPE3_9MICO|nr:YdcF family protein [Antiquaquibacter oligotrophicus]MDH6181861.1 hypothetical protein [Antiquaquibacter oligotrophicus]UDF12462.1 YdcF family protein [Antiquaquibacter oligotrophicus]
MTVRTLLTASVAVMAAFVGWAVVGLPLFVFPQVDEPREADVVFVLGPIRESNLAKAVELMDEGFSGTLVLSTPTNEVPELCAGAHDFEVLCFGPDPSTTQGEAQELARMAAARDWDSAMVVAMTPHISRARLLIERCFTGEMTMVSHWQPTNFALWTQQYFYQTGAYIKALATPGC